eukprot:350179-Chlamydomonas_euryale.AAC.2
MAPLKHGRATDQQKKTAQSRIHAPSRGNTRSTAAHHGACRSVNRRTDRCVERQMDGWLDEGSKA